MSPPSSTMLRLAFRARSALARPQCLARSRFVALRLPPGRTIFSSPVRLAEFPAASSTASSSSASVGPKRRTFVWKGVKFCGFIVGSMGLGLVTFLGVIFIHDAFTYTTRHIERVPVSPLALHLELGGPKNLPIARVLIDDEEVCCISLLLRARRIL